MWREQDLFMFLILLLCVFCDIQGFKRLLFCWIEQENRLIVMSLFGMFELIRRCPAMFRLTVSHL